jgi:superfamily II DNA or RNA helicase
MPVKLRPFQAQLKTDVLAAWGAGARDVMAVSATGSGKTVFFSDVVQNHAGASVVIAHRQELVSQISIALARNGVRHRVIGSTALQRTCAKLHADELGRSYVDPSARCAAAGVDTLVRMDPRDSWFRQVTLRVHDEAHHVLRENKWGAAAAMFPNAIGLHVTATPTRADGAGLGRHADGLVDAMILAPGMRDLIDMGYLTDYRIYAPPSAVDLSRVAISSATGDFNAAQVRDAVHQSGITGDVVSHYCKLAAGKLGVTFAVDVAHASEIAEAFRAAGVPAEVVSAKTPDALRAAILRRFKNRDVLQLVNVDLFGEGFDLPAIECVSMARPTQSFSLYAQQFGRALRLMIPGDLVPLWDTFDDATRRACIAASSKPRAIIIDHVNNVIRHGGPPDRRMTWSLDRRERRSKPADDAIPLRTCLNLNANGTGEPCLQPYERVHKACPHCGYAPEPAGRSLPAQVDGDLIELDAATLAALRGDIERADAPFSANPYLAPEINGAHRKHHAARQEAQATLRETMALWGGLHTNARGAPMNEAHRRFYFQFGTDAATAQTLGTRDALALAERIRNDLQKQGVIPG